MKRTLVCAAALTALAMAPAVAPAQFIEPITDFEGTFSAPTFIAEVIFHDPGFAEATRGLDPAVGNDSYLSDILVVPSPFTEVTSGTQSMVAFWGWLDAADHTSWIRLSTNNTQDIPNPALHLGGKVRMWLGARAWTDGTFATQTLAGSLKVGIGVRETGVGVPQGFDGGQSGLVEWVGLSSKLSEIVSGTNGICDSTAAPATDDVQLVGVGLPAPSNGACIDGGTNGLIESTRVGDDTLQTIPVGMANVPADGVMRLYEFNLPALELSGNVFGFTGDGSLGATPNNRGTLEHMVITNDPGNAAVNSNVWLIFIDDVEFESPVLDPPVIQTVPNPPRPLGEEVTVDFVKTTANLVELFRLPGTSLGSIDPAGATSVLIPTTPLGANIQIVARQTVGTDTSDDSAAVAVVSEGNGPLRLATAIRETDQHDAGLNCGDDGTGFDPNAASTLEFVGATTVSAFGIPDGRTFSPQANWFEVTFDPCVDGVVIFSGNGIIDVNSTGPTVGVWEGLYFRMDANRPTNGPFTVYLDDLTLKNAGGLGMDCMVDDFESYTPDEVIVEGTVAGTPAMGVADSVAAGDDIQVVPQGNATFLGQIVVSGGPNGVIDTAPATGEGVDRVHARFNNPGVAGTSIGVADSPDQSEITSEDAFSGTKSLKVQWAFVDAVNGNNTLRLTTNGSTATNPPESLLNPDSVVELTNAGCEDGVDIVFSVMMRFEPPPVPGDCNLDGDVDLGDYACFQQCFGATPVPPECVKVSLAPNGAPDNVINLDDFELFEILLGGPR